jgi:hypothetical protein
MSPIIARETVMSNDIGKSMVKALLSIYETVDGVIEIMLVIQLKLF